MRSFVSSILRANETFSLPVLEMKDVYLGCRVYRLVYKCNICLQIEFLCFSTAISCVIILSCHALCDNIGVCAEGSWGWKQTMPPLRSYRAI